VLTGQSGFTGLYPVIAQEQNEQVRVVATRIEWDGTMQRGMVDTGHCGGGPQWEDLTARALAVPPPYRPVPGSPVYHVGLDDGTVVLVAEHDLCGSLLDLVTAVLAMGDAVLTRSPGFANRSASPPQPLIVVSQTGGTAPDSDARAGHLLDPDLRLRIWAHWPDARHWSTDQMMALHARRWLAGVGFRVPGLAVC
jgi:hypothetical protein